MQSKHQVHETKIGLWEFRLDGGCGSRDTNSVAGILRLLVRLRHFESLFVGNVRPVAEQPADRNQHGKENPLDRHRRLCPVDDIAVRAEGHREL